MLVSGPWTPFPASSALLHSPHRQPEDVSLRAAIRHSKVDIFCFLHIYKNRILLWPCNIWLFFIGYNREGNYGLGFRFRFQAWGSFWSECFIEIICTLSIPWISSSEYALNQWMYTIWVYNTVVWHQWVKVQLSCFTQMMFNWNYQKLNPEPFKCAWMSDNDTKYSFFFLYHQYLLWII